MQIIALPIDLTNIKINDSNIENVTYQLSYFKAENCILKSPSDNDAYDLIKSRDGIGGENDSIYEKFIPISQARELNESKALGFEFDIMDYDYPDYYVSSELFYREWVSAIRFQQKVEYKKRSLLEIHNISPDKIQEVMDDCEEVEVEKRAEYQLSLMNQIWDPNLYAIYDDNIVWGVGYSEVEAFSSALENHVWLERFIGGLAPEIVDDMSALPYENVEATFIEMLELIMKNAKNWAVGEHGLTLGRCSRPLFDVVNRNGLVEFDFTETKGYIELADTYGD